MNTEKFIFLVGQIEARQLDLANNSYITKTQAWTEINENCKNHFQDWTFSVSQLRKKFWIRCDNAPKKSSNDLEKRLIQLKSSIGYNKNGKFKISNLFHQNT